MANKKIEMNPQQIIPNHASQKAEKYQSNRMQYNFH